KKGRYPEAKKAIRKGVIFLVLILALLGGHLITDYYMLKREYNRLDTEMIRLFKKTLPQVTRIVDPVQQLKVEIQQLEEESASTAMTGSDRRVLDLLADLSRRIPKTVDVHVSRMVMDPKSVRIGGETDTFNSVDSLKNALTPSAFFSEVTISSANLDRKNNRVKFEMKLKRNRGQALPKRVGPSAG
ncbi:MAG: PilN domain-containing protein, partial [Deltaproteobacteria bacterium]|nr:PilN domain-containing protein [Deltaproteobacteria bacterium]